MIAEVTSFMGGVKSATEIVQALVSMKTDAIVSSKIAELNGIIISLNNQLLSLQTTAFGLQEENIKLREEIRDCKEKTVKRKDWKRKAKRYEFAELFPGGPKVYAYKPGPEDREIEHKVCAACFEAEKRSILQKIRYEFSGAIYKCFVCGSELCDHTDRPPSIIGTVKSGNKWDSM